MLNCATGIEPQQTQQSANHVPLRWRHNDHAGVSNHQPHGCLLNRLFRRKSKKTSKLRVTGLCVGKFPAQMASYAENVSIWWRHDDNTWDVVWAVWRSKSPGTWAFVFRLFCVASNVRIIGSMWIHWWPDSPHKIIMVILMLYQSPVTFVSQWQTWCFIWYGRWQHGRMETRRFVCKVG